MPSEQILTAPPPSPAFFHPSMDPDHELHGHPGSFRLTSLLTIIKEARPFPQKLGSAQPDCDLAHADRAGGKEPPCPGLVPETWLLNSHLCW